MPLDPLRRQILTLARDAQERRRGFEIIETLGIPALWDRFIPTFSEKEARTLCKTYYLDLVRHVRGHSGLVRRDSIRRTRDSILSKLEGSLLSGAVSGDPRFRRECVQAAKRLQRELLPSQGWAKAKRGRFILDVPGDTLLLSFDYGTYRDNLEFDLRVAALRLRLAPSVLFCVYLDGYLAYGPDEAFSERFANAMELVVLFGNRLRDVER